MLREMLSAHSRISLSVVETHFLPYWIENWESYGDLSDRRQFLDFYAKARRLPYFEDCEAIDEPVITAPEWHARCADFSLQGVYEALMRYATGADADSDVLWGDKTPEYLIHVDALVRLFPNARIVHIVRDARDQALSSHRTWGKNMFRAAQRWVDEISEFRRQAARYPFSAIEVRFEDVLNDPGAELRRLTKFLGLEFEASMLTVPGQAEPTGAAHGQTSVMSQNQRKYDSQMDRATQRRIEEIALPVLEIYGYPVPDGLAARPISATGARWFRLRDGLNILRGEAEERGLVGGTRYVLRTLRSQRSRTADIA